MACTDTVWLKATPASVGVAAVAILVTGLISRIFYNLYFHPLARFPGPWYAASFSIVGALVSVKQKEPEFFMYLVRKYGSRPIRISPSMLLFPRPSAIKDIYWDPKCNLKSGLYGTGALGPPHLFTTLDGEQHKALRKALSNAPWTIGQLKNTWEYRFDDQIKLFVQKMNEHAADGRIICLSDKVAGFAADIMSMISFGEAFGCVKNQRDEKEILTNWRKGLDFFGFVGRFRFFRERIIKLPIVGLWFLPSVSNDSGMGWLMCEADRQVTEREKLMESGYDGKPDFMQHCIEARYSDGSPLSPSEKRAHCTLLIQAGADTTGTALGSILRFLVTNPKALIKAREEIIAADNAGKLSDPVLYEETRVQLPYFVACIKEGLRLNPPATNLFARITPAGGKTIDGEFIPGGTEITSNAYVVQRDKDFYGLDAEEFRPARWLESEQRSFQMEAVQFTFGVGPRTCLGKDIAIMELYKLLPEVIRRFDIELKKPGRYIVAGGVAYNEDFMARLSARDERAAL